MEVFSVQQIFLPGCYPFIPAPALTFGAVTVTTTIVRDTFFTTIRAPLHVTPQGRRPASFDGGECFFVVHQNGACRHKATHQLPKVKILLLRREVVSLHPNLGWLWVYFRRFKSELKHYYSEIDID